MLLFTGIGLSWKYEQWTPEYFIVHIPTFILLMYICHKALTIIRNQEGRK